MDTTKVLPVLNATYSNKYLIASTGVVISLTTKRPMRPHPRNGYLSVGFTHKGFKNNFMVHRLVAEAFIPNPNNLEFVNHKDGNKLNNDVSNLEWITPKENASHSQNVLGKLRKTVPVCRFTMDGVYDATFNSIEEAATATKISSKHIPCVCAGRRGSAGGYKWKYVNDVRLPPPEDGRKLPKFPKYLITNKGEIYSLHTSRYLVLNKQASGYMVIKLCDDGKQKDFYVHVLVAKLYLEPVPGKPLVNHIDSNKSNNSVENLEWVTASENAIHYHAAKAAKAETQSTKRTVHQLDKQGNFIAEFLDFKEASKVTGVSSTGIRNTCAGRQKTSGNFCWKYNEI